MSSTHSSGGVIHANLGESEFLKLETEKARAKMASSLKQAKTALSHGVDPRVPMQRHPIVAISVAALAGFVATLLAVPSKKEREFRHLERLHRAMNPEPLPPHGDSKEKAAVNGALKEAKPALWVFILKELVTFLKPILVAQITNKFREQAQRPSADDASGGQI